MATAVSVSRDRFLDAFSEAHEAWLTGIQAGIERGCRASRALVDEARAAEGDRSALVRVWLTSPTSVYEKLDATLETQFRAQQRALVLARDALKSAGEYSGEAREATRRMVRANGEAAAAVLEVLEDGQGFVVRQSGAEQGAALAFGEAALAGAAGEQAALLLAVAKGDAEVAVTAQAVVGALGVLAAEAIKVFHERQAHNSSQAMDNAAGAL